MNRQQTFEQFLSGQGVEVPLAGFLVNLAIAALLAWALGLLYARYSQALSNRRAFAANFVLLTTTTTLVIAVVKSSLALSLGLVGALSIVRFRAAIKEPEELAYLFVAIAIGLGLGADQRGVTLAAFAGIAALIAVRGSLWKPGGRPNLFLTVTSENPSKIGLDRIVEILERHCSEVNLRRFDEDAEVLEASFQVEYDGFEQLERTREELQAASGSVKVSFLDNRETL